MIDVKKKPDSSDQAILEKLNEELGPMIEELAGTELDYDPAVEAASIEAIRNSDTDEE